MLRRASQCARVRSRLASQSVLLKLFRDLIRNAGLAGCYPANPVWSVVWARVDNLPRRKPHAPGVRLTTRSGADAEHPCFTPTHRSRYAQIVAHHDQCAARRAARGQAEMDVLQIGRQDDPCLRENKDRLILDHAAE